MFWLRNKKIIFLLCTPNYKDLDGYAISDCVISTFKCIKYKGKHDSIHGTLYLNFITLHFKNFLDAPTKFLKVDFSFSLWV